MLEQRSKTPVEQRDYGMFYVIFSGVLFLGTMWAVWDEVRIRRPWKEYQTRYFQLLHERLDSVRTDALLQVDSSEVARLEEELKKAEAGFESDEYRQSVDGKTDLLKRLDIATREWRFSKSRSDAAYYQYKKVLMEGGDASPQKAEVRNYEADIAKYFEEMNELQKQIAVFDETIYRYRDAVEKNRAALKALFEKADSYNLKLAGASRATIDIRQVMLNDFELTPFNEVKARIDRCQTCHLGWNEDVMEGVERPFAKHPLPELLAKHNPESFGCTPCHRGQGPALTAGFAHGEDDHYWETPILKGVDVYATCNSCHSNESVLKNASPFTKAKQILIESGCFGCHEIKGYTDIPKIGPMLNSLTSKTRPEWIFRWVKNPKDYNPHTRMPAFQFSDDQAGAITAYLVSIGQQSGFAYERPRGSYGGGSAAKGRQIFETVGCQACHTVGSDTKIREAKRTGYDIAPELTRVGSKVNPDWLFDWLKNPRHFNPTTRMPSLRLTDDEARHLVAYLSSLKDTRTPASVSLDLKNPEKIARGDKLIREFGCAGCHEIKGMENEGKVSVNLSDFGRKKVEQMDFGDTRPFPHDDELEYQENSDGKVSVKQTWGGWVYGKLKNPRLYQTERIVQKMPIFTFTDEEIGLLRAFLISMTKEVPLPTFQRTFDKRMQDIETGRRLTMYYNCIQCHNLEDRGGYILAKFDDPGLGPPPLPETQGAKVQEQWLHGFLQNPSTIRPWLKLRMPTFQLNEDETGKIMRYFLGMSKQDFQIRDYGAVSVEAKYMAPGRKLFEAYQCANCHPSGSADLSQLTVSPSDAAPDLGLAAGRLKPEWIVEWIVDPHKLEPGTRMPTFFYEGVAPDQETLGGNPREQAKALQTYIWSLGKRSRPAASAQ